MSSSVNDNNPKQALLCSAASIFWPFFDSDSEDEDESLLDDVLLQAVSLQTSITQHMFNYSNDKYNKNFRNFIRRNLFLSFEIFSQWEDLRFYSNFRMSKRLFRELVEEIEQTQKPQHIQEQDWVQFTSNGVRIITFDTAVGIFLYWLASDGCKLRDLENIFGYPKSTLHGMIVLVRKMIYQRLSAKYIYVPRSTEEWKLITKRWSTRYEEGKKYSPLIFPNVVGAIDGTHIPIVPPNKKKYNTDIYYCRKGYHSVVMQGICDDRGIFMNVNIGQPGSSHDSRVFRLSGFWQSMHSSEENEIKKNFPSGYFILGDAAYASREWLLPAYRGIISGKKLIYNYIHSGTRMVIERALGRLKGRWRKLKLMHVQDMDEVNMTIQCAVVLHNFIEMRMDYNIRKDENECATWEREEIEQRRAIQHRFLQEFKENDQVDLAGREDEEQDFEIDSEEEREQESQQRDTHSQTERVLVRKGGEMRIKVTDQICSRIVNGAKENVSVMRKYYSLLDKDSMERDVLEDDLRFLNDLNISLSTGDVNEE